ncbi:hypothetical protein DPMN_132915, partial [Dreissena polymorpha]
WTAVVDGSNSTNVAVRYPAWSWRNWKSLIDEHFNALPGIRKYQYFRMSSATHGVVMVKTSSDGEETSFCLLKNKFFRFTNTDRQVPILAAGLSAARRDNVRSILSARVALAFRVRQHVAFVLLLKCFV